MSQYDLVLGSKPDAPLPDIAPRRIYTANGAASLARHYRARGTPRVISIVATKQMQKPEVRDSIIAAAPDEIIGRKDYPLAAEVFADVLPDTKTSNLSMQAQFRLQQQVFGPWIYLALTHKHGLGHNVGRVIKFLLGRKPVLGVSTGAFAIVYALMQDQEIPVVVSGIGLEAGGHFYGQGKFKSTTGRKDYMILPHMPDKLKSRLYTTDTGFSRHVGVRTWGEAVL